MAQSQTSFSSTEQLSIQRILHGIDDLLQYKGAQMPVQVLLELEDALRVANDVVMKQADERGRELAGLDNEYLRDISIDLHKIVCFLSGVLDEYRKMEGRENTWLYNDFPHFSN